MRILLAEDDVALADAVCSYLRSKAYVVDVAASLAQASAALHAAEYAAVLLDLHLTDGDGLALLPQVHELFLAFKSAQEQSVDLEVASAFEIAPEQASRLADAIGRKLQRTVRVSTTVDKTLIGGVVIRTADLVIDGSVRGRLAKLSEAMNS